MYPGKVWECRESDFSTSERTHMRLSKQSFIIKVRGRTEGVNVTQSVYCSSSMSPHLCPRLLTTCCVLTLCVVWKRSAIWSVTQSWWVFLGPKWTVQVLTWSRVSMTNFFPPEAECDSLISVMRPDLTQPTHGGIPKDSFRDILFLWFQVLISVIRT